MRHWDKYKHIHKDWNWGEPEAIDPNFLQLLDKYIDALPCNVFISNAARKSSQYENSAHIKDDLGLVYGCDLYPLMKNNKAELLDCFLLATKFPFKGIGIYPMWKYKHGDIIERGGLHLDITPHRKLRDGQSCGHWLAETVWDKNEEKWGYEMIGINRLSLRRHGLSY